MKTFKLIATLLIIFTMTSVVAQNKGQVLKTRTTKTYDYKVDGKTVPYRITVYKTSTAPLKLKESEKNEVNQDIKKTSKYVTKLIYVDNDMYSDYDKYIVLRYIKDGKDTFEMKPTERGFMVIVDDRHVEYIFGEGVYFVNNADRDFFFVDEFDTI